MVWKACECANEFVWMTDYSWLCRKRVDYNTERVPGRGNGTNEFAGGRNAASELIGLIMG